MRARATASIVFSAILLFSSVVLSTGTAVDKKTAPHITKDTVWNTDRQTVQVAKQRCADTGGRQLEDCFADAMESLGATAEAVSFTRSFGGGAFLRKFREAGRVDVAYVVLPFRANEQNEILLVNGDPPIVDVDDISLLPKETLEQDKNYVAIKRSFPKVTLWPGDRSAKFPMVESLPDGGQDFVVPYTLRNLCHACEVLGSAFFSFSFDKEGRFVGIRFLKVEPVPKKVTPRSESRRESEQIRFVVMAEEGKEFTVRLDSNRTTGYQWRPAGPLDERIVKLVRSEYVSFDVGGGISGAGGEEVWTFLAVAKGDSEIAMEYVRPWDKTPPPAKTATIHVSVRTAATR